jgi:hypothetical protein
VEKIKGMMKRRRSKRIKTGGKVILVAWRDLKLHYNVRGCANHPVSIPSLCPRSFFSSWVRHYETTFGCCFYRLWSFNDGHKVALSFLCCWSSFVHQDQHLPFAILIFFSLNQRQWRRI